MEKSLLCLVLLVGMWTTLFAQPLKLVLSKEQVEVYDFQEIKIDIKKPDPRLNPFKKANMSKEDEQMYYAYAAARYSAYENIMWDIANEYHLFRTPE